jgi:hypothetical protein
MELQYTSFTFKRNGLEIFVLFKPLEKGTTMLNSRKQKVTARFEVSVDVNGDMISLWHTSQQPSTTIAKEFAALALKDLKQTDIAKENKKKS